MICDQAIELLPWLLNGTLEGAEREEVRRHLETCDRCREALAETRGAWSVFTQHLSSQDLVALAWGETPSGVDAATAAEHLACCPQCAADLELARTSRRLEEDDNIALFPTVKRQPEAGTSSRPWRAAALAASLAGIVGLSGWFFEARQSSDLAARLAQAESPAQTQQPSPGEGSSLRGQIARLEGEVKRLAGLQQENGEKIAAAQTQVAQLEQERAALARPQATAMVELSSVVRGGTAEATVPSGRSVVLLLPAADGQKEHRAEIQDGHGKIVWTANGLPVTQGFHSVLLPAGSLPPGHYTLRISGREESWSFQITP